MADMCKFYGLPPSEFRSMTYQDWRTLESYMDAYRKAQKKNGR